MVKTKFDICSSYNSWPTMTVIKRKCETKFWHEHFLSKNMKKKKDWGMRSCYFPLLFREEFLSTVYMTFKNCPISSLTKGHCMQCNAYTPKLTCTGNLSRLSHITIQVTLLLINSKLFSTVLTILLISIKNSSQVTKKAAKSEGNTQIHKVARIVFLVFLSEAWENEKI